MQGHRHGVQSDSGSTLFLNQKHQSATIGRLTCRSVALTFALNFVKCSSIHCRPFPSATSAPLPAGADWSSCTRQVACTHALRRSGAAACRCRTTDTWHAPGRRRYFPATNRRIRLIRKLQQKGVPLLPTPSHPSPSHSVHPHPLGGIACTRTWMVGGAAESHLLCCRRSRVSGSLPTCAAEVGWGGWRHTESRKLRMVSDQRIDSLPPCLSAVRRWEKERAGGMQGNERYWR